MSVWYVGPANTLPAVTYWVQTCIARDGGVYAFSMKEYPRLYEALGPKTNYATKFVGWWCVDDTAEWAVFRTLDHANKWVQGINNP